MKLNLKETIVERTWLSDKEAEVILSVVADCIKKNYPNLIGAIDSILQIENSGGLMDLPVYINKRYQPGSEFF